jgi:hypothetical protein
LISFSRNWIACRVDSSITNLPRGAHGHREKKARRRLPRNAGPRINVRRSALNLSEKHQNYDNEEH